MSDRGANPVEADGDWAGVYDDLRGIARRLLARESAAHTLQPTALVHELFVRFQRDGRFADAGRAEILAHAARAMRDVLIEHARRRRADKRGGGAGRVPLDDALALYESRAVDLLALDEALRELAEYDAELVRLVELRFFGGLTEEEVAALLGVSDRTVRRSWRVARTVLSKAMRTGEEPA